MTLEPIWPAIASVLSAIADWIGVALRRAWIEYAAKPAAILFLIAWMLLAVSPDVVAEVPVALVLAALTFSLIGDILLMLPSARFFAGLVIFLLAHLAYILAFNWRRLAPGPGEIVVGILILLSLALLLPRVRLGLVRSGRPRLAAPVAAYGIVLGIMLWSTLGTLLRTSWLTGGATAMAVGGLAFFASDLSLVWDRFVRPIPGGRVATHILYHLAQLALTAGVIRSVAA